MPAYEHLQEVHFEHLSADYVYAKRGTSNACKYIRTNWSKRNIYTWSHSCTAPTYIFISQIGSGLNSLKNCEKCTKHSKIRSESRAVYAEAHCGAFVIAEDGSNRLSRALYTSIQPIRAFMGHVHSSVSINFASLLSLRSVNLLRYDNCELRKRWQGAPLHVKRKTMHHPAHMIGS